MKKERVFFENFFGNLHSGLFVFDRKLQLFYLNSAAERMMGGSLEVLQGKDFADLFALEGELARQVKNAQQEARSVILHDYVLHLAGKQLNVQIEIAPTGSPDAVQGVVLCIHEQALHLLIKSESRIRDRLSMMGTLASGLAHEIKNPLSGIRAAAQILVAETEDDENQDFARIIVQEVDRMDKLMRDLLDFTRPKQMISKSININQLISELLKTQKASLQKSDIKLQLQFDPSLPELMADPFALQQVFLNLIKNALEAMRQGGNLLIQTRYCSDTHLLPIEGKLGPVIEVMIQDSGSGISAEDLNNIFTPFFSTKAEGTGLGLMVSQKIIQEHHGYIELKSKPGQGTQAYVYLPI